MCEYFAQQVVTSVLKGYQTIYVVQPLAIVKQCHGEMQERQNGLLSSAVVNESESE